MRTVLKHVPLDRRIQLMIGGIKTVNLEWVNKVAIIGYTWIFVYESLRRYEGRMNAAPTLPKWRKKCNVSRRLHPFSSVFVRISFCGHILQLTMFAGQKQVTSPIVFERCNQLQLSNIQRIKYLFST